MSAESDYLVDRKGLRRKLGFWRAVAFVVALAALVGLGFAYAGRASSGLSQNHIARVDISGFITGDQKTIELLERVGKGRAKAVIVQVDSPGGTVSGSERLFTALRELSEKKPTVALVRGLAASGGYLAAMGAERIVAQETSIVGSIGVLFQVPNVSRLLDTVGVRMETVKSAPLKASPNPFEPTTPAAEAAIQSLVTSNFEWFRRVVSDRRGLAGEPLAKVTDGRIFTGQQALNLKLIDEIGGEKQAVAWLEREKGVDKDLPIREWKRSTTTEFGLWSAAAAVSEAAGLEGLARALQSAGRGIEQPSLDGLLAVWQP